MTTKTAEVRAKKRKGSRLDLPMSLFAAGSVAFAAFAMPGDLFSEIVLLSGLPNILSAAEPPLGATARTAVIAAAFAASFALVFLILRALDKPAPRKMRQAEDEEVESAPPRLRRADAHPDAPPRRPLFAGTDLGEPIEPIESESEDEPRAEALADEEYDDAEWQRTLPTFFSGGDEFDWGTAEAPLVEEERAQEEPAIDEPAQPVAEEPAVDEPVEMVAEEPTVIADEEAPEFEPSDEYETVFEQQEPIEAEIEDEQAPEAAQQPAFQPEPEPEPIAPGRRRRLHFEPDPEENASIPGLMQRLEHGLVRRKRGWNPLEAARAAAPADDRLKSAIEDLQRMAKRSA